MLADLGILGDPWCRFFIHHPEEMQQFFLPCWIDLSVLLVFMEKKIVYVWNSAHLGMYVQNDNLD